MNLSINLRALLAFFAIACLAVAASAQMSTTGGKGGNPPGGGDDPIIGGGGGIHSGPPSTPEPFTMALGAGAVGLYARRRFVKSRRQNA